MTLQEAYLLKRGDKIIRTREQRLDITTIHSSYSKSEYGDGSVTKSHAIDKGEILTFFSLYIIYEYESKNGIMFETDEINYDCSGIITFEYGLEIVVPFMHLDVLNEDNLRDSINISTSYIKNKLT